MTEWQLTPDGPALSGRAALVVPVLTAADERAVLKITGPLRQPAQEHLAFRHWGGHAAVRLLRADPGRRLLLLERADGARDLTALPDVEACEVVAGLYERLHVPAPPQLVGLSRLAAQWSAELRRLPRTAPVPRRFVEQAAALAGDLADDAATDGRLLHGDLQYDHVLAGGREPWLAISPKPISGDPHFEVAPLLWNRWAEIASSADVREAVRGRFLAVVDAADFDEDRTRDWVIVRTIAALLHDVGSGQPTPDAVTRAVAVVKAVQD